MKHLRRLKRILLLVCVALTQTGFAQPTDIRSKITDLLAGKQLTAGIALCDLSSADTLSIRGDRYFPMQSVFKFPVALAALQKVDNGLWRLGDSIFISRSSFPAGTWSPLRERYPAGEVYITLADLLRYTVSHSDNNGCDLLLRMLGGPAAVNEYLRTLGIADITIEKDEEQMHRDWEAQFANRTTPRAMIELLRLFEAQRLLGAETQAFLWETMAATSTGSVRSKLPATAVVVHKTGSSGRNAAGISAATNDAGILILPDGRRLAYAVFLTQSAEPDEVNAGIIADLAQLLYNEYGNTPHDE